MPIFTKRPVAAHRWFKNGDHPDDYAHPKHGTEHGRPMTYSPQHQRINDWEGQVVRRHRTPSTDGMHACSHCGHVMDEHGWIDTLEGGHVVCPGDWVITGAAGERYPCKPDIFEATYEPVGAPGEAA